MVLRFRAAAPGRRDPELDRPISCKASRSTRAWPPAPSMTTDLIACGSAARAMRTLDLHDTVPLANPRGALAAPSLRVSSSSPTLDDRDPQRSWPSVRQIAVGHFPLHLRIQRLAIAAAMACPFLRTIDDPRSSRADHSDECLCLRSASSSRRLDDAARRVADDDGRLAQRRKVVVAALATRRGPRHRLMGDEACEPRIDCASPGVGIGLGEYDCCLGESMERRQSFLYATVTSRSSSVAGW